MANVSIRIFSRLYASPHRNQKPIQIEYIWKQKPKSSTYSVDRRRPGRSLHCNTTSTVVLLGSHPNTLHAAQNKRLPQHSSIPDIRLHTRFNDRRSPALPSRNFSLCNFRTITNSNPKLANVHQKSRSQSTWITNQSLPISFKSSTQWKK